MANRRFGYLHDSKLGNTRPGCIGKNCRGPRHAAFGVMAAQLLARWKMVELDVYALIAQVLEPTKVIRWAETGKFLKVADQMRLVEISMLERDLFPRGLRQRIHLFENPLKPLDSIESLGIQTHFRAKDVDKSTITESGLPCQLALPPPRSPAILRRSAMVSLPGANRTIVDCDRGSV